MLLITKLVIGFVITIALLHRLRVFQLLAKHDQQDKSNANTRVKKVKGWQLLMEMWNDFLNGRFAEGMLQRHNTYGQTFLVGGLNAQCVYTIDIQNIKTITLERSRDFGKSYWAKAASYFIGNGVLVNDGSEWRHSRALLKAAFDTLTVSSSQSRLLEIHTDNLISSIKRREGSSFEFRAEVCKYTLDLVTEILCGISTYSLSSEENKDAQLFLRHVHEFEQISAAFINTGVIAIPRILLSSRTIYSSVTGMRHFFRSMMDQTYRLKNTQTEINEKQKGFITHKTMLQPLLDSNLPKSRIQGELQNLFFASFDTTSTLITNLFYVLSRRQDIQSHLRNEITNLNGRPPTKEEVSGPAFVYLRATVKEALRLYSPVTYHSRTALVDTTLPLGPTINNNTNNKNDSHPIPNSIPIPIPKGTEIIWSTYALNRSKQIYGSDAEEFRPERWLPSSCSSSSSQSSSPASQQHKQQNEAFHPFGLGPRQCMGRDTALTTIYYVTIRLLQEFSVIEMPEDKARKGFVEAQAVSYVNGLGTWVRMVV